MEDLVKQLLAVVMLVGSAVVMVISVYLTLSALAFLLPERVWGRVGLASFIQELKASHAEAFKKGYKDLTSKK